MRRTLIALACMAVCQPRRPTPAWVRFQIGTA
jgi:hypothetical protein